MFSHQINGCFCYADVFENLKYLDYHVDQQTTTTTNKLLLIFNNKKEHVQLAYS